MPAPDVPETRKGGRRGPRGPLRALITGGMGFIGSHLAATLLDKGMAVTVLDDLSTGRFSNIECLIDHPLFTFAIDDVSNEVVLDRLASEADLIYHLAASVGVQLIVDDPMRTIVNNVMGTEAVLKAALRYRAKVLVASSSEVYGKGSRVPFSEEDDVVLGSTSHSRWAYAASKMTDEFLALSYHRQKGLPVIVFRLFNTTGPRQSGQYGMVVPRFVKAVLTGEPLQVYGDGGQSRCFLHVGDAVEAIVGLSECEDAVGEVFNIGSTEELTILDLAKKVLQFVRPLQVINPDEAPPPSRPLAAGIPTGKIEMVPYDEAYGTGFEDMRRRVPDISKIRRYLGWEPQRRLREIISDVVSSLADEGGERTVRLDEVEQADDETPVVDSQNV